MRAVVRSRACWRGSVVRRAAPPGPSPAAGPGRRVVAPRQVAVGLAERLHREGKLRLGHADPAVATLIASRRPASGRVERHGAAGLGELDAVGEQVEEHLRHRFSSPRRLAGCRPPVLRRAMPPWRRAARVAAARWRSRRRRRGPRHRARACRLAGATSPGCR